MSDAENPQVRIRGIYATALTEYLQGTVDPVQASPPIRRRFDADFPIQEYDARITDTADRQGVGVIGEPTVVERLRNRLTDIGIDTLAWTDPTPKGAIFTGEITGTLGSGAVVDLGPREGFLPFDAIEDHVVKGDTVRVQIHEPAPLWGDDRPVVGGDIRVTGGIAGLVRGADGPTAAVPDTERATELVRTTELLSVDVPDGWAVRWQRGAADADIETLETALERMADRAATVDTALETDEHPTPIATVWLWFGRASRFAFDSIRRSVTTTMAGHHRIKAGGQGSSAAVDFVEALCDIDPDPNDDEENFPIDVVLGQFGPAVGDEVRLEHGKPDGRRFSLGRGVVTDRTDDGRITVEREMSGRGSYDALDVPRESGDIAVTKLKEGRWWYPTVYRDADGGTKGTYVNICTPVELFPRAAVYVDLHIDVIRHADGTVERVDDDELTEAVDAGHISPELAEKARTVATGVERALEP
ncbi:MAG: DUF402 domain-containing protein [Halobacteriales archaeon]